MKLEERSIFRQLVRQRLLMGILAMLCSFGVLFFVFGIQLIPQLDSLYGVQFRWMMWTGEDWWKLLVIGGILFFATLTANFAMTEGKKVCQLYPKTEEKQFEVSIPTHFSKEKIVEATLVLAKEMEVEVAGIYIGENPTPNAFTTFALSKGDIVFLHSNLLDIMDEQSLHAVIAHELGHIKNRDAWYSIGILVPRNIIRLWLILFIVQLVGVALLANSFTVFMVRAVEVLGGFFAFGLCESFLNSVTNWYSQIKEKMADAYAAEYTSPEGMINGLLRLNDRSHTLMSFIAALKKEDAELSNDVLQEALQIFPIGSKTGAEIKKNTSKYYAQAHFALLMKRLRIDVSKEQAEAWLSEFLVHQKEKEEEKERDEQEQTEEKKEDPPFIWQDFDWNQDGLLQKDEIVALQKALEQDRRALTDKEGAEGEHPPVRERVLFILSVFQEDFSS